jgi:hypothetical protein
LQPRLEIPLPACFDVHGQHVQQEVGIAGFFLGRLFQQAF